MYDDSFTSHSTYGLCTGVPEENREEVLTVSASWLHQGRYHRLLPENGPCLADGIITVDDAPRTTKTGIHVGFAISTPHMYTVLQTRHPRLLSQQRVGNMQATGAT